MIRLAIPTLPPTFNHAYMLVRLGKKGSKLALTRDGRAYKKETKAHLASKYPAELATLLPNTPYFVLVRLSVKELENKTWPKSASRRYRTLDTTNRFKILEDVLAEVSAIDDSNNMFFGGFKVQGTTEGTEVLILNAETTAHPVIDAIYDAF